MSDIVVIGSLNMDLVVKTAHMPVGGETLHGEAFHTIPGGKGANQAVAIARLGGRVAMIGRVGQDGFGEALRKNLMDDQVDVAHVKTDPEKPTGVALIVVEDSGENRIIVVGGANTTVSVEDVRECEALLRQARMLVTQFETPMPVVEAALRFASQNGILTVVNAAPAYPIRPEVLGLIDYLIVNETEAGMLSGVAVNDLETAKRAGRALLSLGAKQVIITLGADGALVCAPDETVYAPSFKVQAVDTTAAGDAFVGGLVNALLHGGATWQEKLRFANAAGALAATRLGAQSSLPTRAEVQALLDESQAI